MIKHIAKEDLLRFALSRGGTITLSDGRAINASGQKINLPPRPPTPPAPLPLDLEAIARQAADAAERAETEQLISLVHDLIEAMKEQQDATPKPVVGWRFNVIRDREGWMSQIKATVVRAGDPGA